MNHEHDENQGLIPVLSERIINGLFKENPTFVLLLGMCPTLAVTTSAVNGLGMGVATLVVLALSNMMISALRKIIPDKIRIPAFIVIIASFVTIVELLLNAYIHSLYDALGLYIPLIVVNCIILGRAEAYAYSNPVLPSLFDGLGMGMGFTVALTIIGSFREILGSGEVFGFRVMPQGYVPVSIFVMAPGAFFVLAMLTALQNKIKEIGTKKGRDMSKIQSGCGGNCMDCTKECKVSIAEPEVVSDFNESDNNNGAKQDNDQLETESPKVAVSGVESVEAENKPKTEEMDTSSSEVPKKTDKKKVSVKKAETKVTLAEEKNLAQESVIEEPVAKESAKSSSNEKESVQSDSVVENLTDEGNATQNSSAVENTNEDTEDDMVLLDINDYKKAIQKNTPSGRKPGRKKNSMAKAQAMLNKAEETLKEENDD